MSTNERYLERTARAWMRLSYTTQLVHSCGTSARVTAVEEEALAELAVDFARAYGACCAIGDAADVDDMVDRLRVFLDRPNEPDEWYEEQQWAGWWAKLRDGTLRSD